MTQATPVEIIKYYSETVLKISIQRPLIYKVMSQQWILTCTQIPPLFSSSETTY